MKFIKALKYFKSWESRFQFPKEYRRDILIFSCGKCISEVQHLIFRLRERDIGLHRLQTGIIDKLILNMNIKIQFCQDKVEF